MKLNWSAAFVALASVSMLTACGGANKLAGLPTNGDSATAAARRGPAAASNTFPVKLVNKTSYPDSDVWFYIVGQKNAGEKTPWFHLIDASGAVKQCEASDGKNGYADYSLSLASIPDHTIQLPSLHGARMYFSIDKKLKIPIGANAIPGSPSGWTASNPNYDTLFDNWEYTSVADDPTTGFNFNLTQVDMLGIPMSIRGVGKTEDNKPVDVTVGFPAGARTKIFAALKAQQKFEKLVISGAQGDLRAIAPNLGIDPQSSKDGKPLFEASYLWTYINRVWTYYTTNTLTTETSQGKYVGKVGSDLYMEFTKAGAKTIYFKRPTTLQIFQSYFPPICNKATGALCPTSGPTAYLPAVELQGAFPAAFNRSTLLVTNDELGIITHTKACELSLSKAYQNGKTNFYSKIMHQNGLNGKAYGFGNDDVCSGSSYAVVRRPDHATVTLLAF